MLQLRDTVRPDDALAVRRIVESTGFFRPDEVEVAVELILTRVEKGAESGYEFLFAEQLGEVVGYACYGPIACTVDRYDLYWIAVAGNSQGQGLGRIILQEAERRIAARAGQHIYIETSGRPQYLPTRAFYQRCGYEIAAVLSDFYDRGDDKVIWRKALFA
jgi:ribosomal protein S18 acetylase RimI-like enzyme